MNNNDDNKHLDHQETNVRANLSAINTNSTAVTTNNDHHQNTLKKIKTMLTPKTPDLTDWFYLVESKYEPMEDDIVMHDGDITPLKEKLHRRGNLNKEIKVSESQKFAEKLTSSTCMKQSVELPDVDLKDIQGLMEPTRTNTPEELRVDTSSRYSPDLDDMLSSMELRQEKPRMSFLHRLISIHKGVLDVSDEQLDPTLRESIGSSSSSSSLKEFIKSPEQRRLDVSLRRSRVKPSNIVHNSFKKI
ncbi:hypothetical protein AKO1_013178 [Acrasis kona]|uniref:Uncharacterized protein n=1 Tax=Acrasis kona TaxID=1008807 RepID=A0AAW2YZ94_9EUKA